MAGYTDATVYLQVKPEFGSWKNSSGRYPIWGAKVVRSTQSRPARPVGDSVLVKLTLRIPDGAFYPLEPTAVVVIPDSMVEIASGVQVIAEDPQAVSVGEEDDGD